MTAALARLYAAIDDRCAAERERMREEVEWARRSLAQRFRWLAVGLARGRKS